MSAAVVTHRTPHLGRRRLVAGFAVATAAVLAAVVAMLTGVGTQDTGAPPPWLPVALLGALGVNAWFFLLRLSIRLRVDGGVLAWESALRRGQVPLHELRVVRPAQPRNLVAITSTTARPVVLLESPHLRAFVEELAEQAPQVQVLGPASVRSSAGPS